MEEHGPLVFTEGELAILDHVPAGITLVDLEGRLIYYNFEASRILDRRPEYLGKDVRWCHKKTDSMERITEMISAFKSGRKDPFHWEIERYGRRLIVRFSPLYRGERLVGCVHMAVAKTP